jgi:hypothetical protein
MTDDQIDNLKIEREVDKLDDLRIESVTLPGPEGDAEEDLMPPDLGGGMPPGPPEAGEPEGGPPETTDLAEIPSDRKGLSVLGEPDFTKLSLIDDNAPIRAQEKVDSVARLLNLPISEKKDKGSKKSHDKGFENRKRQKNNPFSDHLEMTMHRHDDNDDSLSGDEPKYKEASERKEDSNPAKIINREIRNASKIPAVFESDDSFITSYLNSNTETHNRISDRLRSTLKSLERNIHINKKKTLLSEENEV